MAVLEFPPVLSGDIYIPEISPDTHFVLRFEVIPPEALVSPLLDDQFYQISSVPSVTVGFEIVPQDQLADLMCVSRSWPLNPPPIAL